MLELERNIHHEHDSRFMLEAYSKLNLIKHSTVLWLNDWDLHEKRKSHLEMLMASVLPSN